jgi:hypothetical protein
MAAQPPGDGGEGVLVEREIVFLEPYKVCTLVKNEKMLASGP